MPKASANLAKLVGLKSTPKIFETGHAHFKLDHSERAVVEDDEFYGQIILNESEHVTHEHASHRPRSEKRLGASVRSCAPMACGNALAIEP